CFTVDGVLDVGGDDGRWTGRDEIAKRIGATVDRTREAARDAGLTAGDAPGARTEHRASDDGTKRTRVHHHVSSVLVDVASPTEATSRSYFFVITAIGPDHWGRYLDRLRRVDGEWLFVERIVVVDGHAPGSLMASS